MKRLLYTLAAVALLVLPTRAGTITKPYTFVAGTTAQSAQVNSDFDTVYSAFNGHIEHANLASGAGIYATDIVPTTVGQAVFGGSVAYQFSNGLIVLGSLNAPFLTASKPVCTDGSSNLTTTCTSGVTSVTASSPLASSGGTTPNITLGALGQSNLTNGYVDLSSSQTVGGAKTFTANLSAPQFISSATGTGVDFVHFGNNCPSSAALTFSNLSTTAVGAVTPSAWGNFCGTNSWITAVDTVGDVAFKGTLEAANASGNSVTYVPPLYAPSGSTATASTAHILATSSTWLSATQASSCAANTTCPTTATIPFGSTPQTMTNYGSCSASNVFNGGTSQTKMIAYAEYNAQASTWTVYWYNASGSTVASNSVLFANYTCTETG